MIGQGNPTNENDLIKRHAQSLRYIADSDDRTGYPELAAERRQHAGWLEELLDYRRKDKSIKQEDNSNE